MKNLQAVIVSGAWLVLLPLYGCMSINYKTTNIDARAQRDVAVTGSTENLTEAADIAPEIKGQLAEKMQLADQVKAGGVSK